MATPAAVQVAVAFTQISGHPAYPYMGEKWQRFTQLLSDKAHELSGLPDKEYAKQFDAYVDELSHETAVSAFEKYQDLLNESAKVQLEVMGYSPTQIRKLLATRKAKANLFQILTEGIDASTVSIGPHGELYFLETEAVEEAPAPATPQGLSLTAAGSGAANAKYLDSLPPANKAKILKHIATHYDADLSYAEIEDEVTDSEAEALYEYITNNALRMQVYRDFEQQPAPTTPTPARRVPTSPITFDQLLTQASSVADAIENMPALGDCAYGAESIVDAVQSLSPGMDEDEVRALFEEAEENLRDCDARAEEAGESFDEGWEGYNHILGLALTYATSIEVDEEPLDDVPAVEEAEEELIKEAPAPSKHIAGLADAVTALAHEANRTTTYHFTQLATAIIKAGAPALAEQFLNMLGNAQAMAPTPADLGRKLGTQAATVAEKKYKLAGPAQANIVTTFSTSHPSSVIATANGIIKGLISAGSVPHVLQSRGRVENALGNAVIRASNLFEGMDDVSARVEIFGFAQLAAKALADSGAFITLPTQIIGVDEPAEPTDIIAAGEDPDDVLAEAEEAATKYIPPPATTAPADLDPTPLDEQPSLPTVMPSQGDLITLIAASGGNPDKFVPLIAETYSGYNDAAAITAAFKGWLISLITQPNSHFGIRWTNAAAQYDIVGSAVFDTTHSISAAPDGNQPPNAAMWRQVGIPISILQRQERAYIEAGGIVKTNGQYESQYAGKSLQGPPQDSENLIPSEIKTPFYFIEANEDGEVQVSINEDAFQGVLSNGAFSVGGSEGGVTAITNGFGAVNLISAGALYTVTGESHEAVTGFLVLLENLSVAECGGVLCVSAFLVEEADIQGVTLTTLTQGVVAFREDWKTAFSNALGDDVHTFATKTNAKKQLVITMAAGPEDFRTQVCVKAVPGNDGEIRYGVRVLVACEKILTFQARSPYKEFMGGSSIATKITDEALDIGYVFGVPPKVVTISGDGLSKDEFTSILDGLRTEVEKALKATLKTGIVLTDDDVEATVIEQSEARI